MILFIHHRYRTSGGEERAVEDLLWLVRERLGEDAALLTRDSTTLRAGAAAAGLLGGGLRPQAVTDAVRHTGARIVHAHNLHPTFGWRALAAARVAGARVVLHLHQYRLVCAIGVCFRDGAQCTRCHGAHTLPGVVHNCRGSRPQALTYAAGVALAQRRLVALADAIVVPSRFAGARLRELGAPVGAPWVVPNVVRGVDPSPPPAAPRGEPFALIVSRLSPEKGVDVAIDACRRARIPLVIAGEGPERGRLDALATAPGSDVRFLGRLSNQALAQLRADAALALAPSRAAETFGLAAAEAMAAGLPVAGSRIGALAELLPSPWMAAPGDADGLAQAIGRVRADGSAASTARERVRALAAPEVAARALSAVYDRVMSGSAPMATEIS